MRKIIITVLVFILTGLFFTSGFAQTPEESLKKAFPKLKFQSLQPSNIKGVYEVIYPNGILYYAPEVESIIVGDIIARDGRNLTQDKQQEILTKNIKEKLKDIPLQKALSIGKGKHTVMEITDPDCPYCRRASEFFSKRTDVTRQIFFYPISSHPKAADKVLYVFCAKDRAKAYEEAMSGKLDDMTFKICEDTQARELLKTHKDVAERLGVRGTPFFFVDGQTAVFGADIPRLEKLLRN
ncbi:MAG: DsbC family protein [Deltaproteobacteria bacterium]|nr:DsbC family protein [Deltaproteobacteria bacterium]